MGTIRIREEMTKEEKREYNRKYHAAIGKKKQLEIKLIKIKTKKEEKKPLNFGKKSS